MKEVDIRTAEPGDIVYYETDEPSFMWQNDLYIVYKVTDEDIHLIRLNKFELVESEKLNVSITGLNNTHIKLYKMKDLLNKENHI